MSGYLGIKESEDESIKEVALLALSCPVPEGWQEVVNNGISSYL